MTFNFVDIDPEHEDASKRVEEADASLMVHKLETEAPKKGIAPEPRFVDPISQKYRQMVVFE